MENNKISETDLAVNILQSAGEAIYFRDLITEVIEKKNIPVQSLAHIISEINTFINMDSRFQHMGKGMWGLAAWAPPQTKKQSASSEEGSTTKSASTSRRRERLLSEIQEQE